MADERYEWLDKEAAERLLRGEPVEAADEHARRQAAQLSRALHRAGRARFEDDGEMPGEAAAMAAFRKARADSAAPAGDALGTVRLAGRPVRTLRFGRPVRFGIAAAVAGCAIGGVAVAAGTGILPTPFGGGGNPLPASSVSAAATPGPLVSETPTDGGALTPPQTPGETSEPPVTPPTSEETGTEPGGESGSTTGEPSDDPGSHGGGSDGSYRERNRDLFRKSVEACRDYRSGRIAPERKQRLEAVAKGPERVERFCDRLLGGGSQDSGAGGSDGDDSGGRGDNNDDEGGDGKGDGSDSDGGQAGRSAMPPVSWLPALGAPAAGRGESVPGASPSSPVHLS